MTTHHRHIGSASNPGPVITRLGAQTKPDGVWCGAMRQLDARMEKAPESSHASIGEELFCVARSTGLPPSPGRRPRLGEACAATTPPALPLDGFFALNPAMANLHRLYKGGRAAIVVRAVVYCERSHFDGQDVLERPCAVRPTDNGWLNRALVQLEPDDRVPTSTNGRLTSRSTRSRRRWCGVARRCRHGCRRR
jgi:uncharacterized protein (DUF1501 family)